MRLMDWLKDLVARDGATLPSRTFIPLLTDGGSEEGVLLVHGDDTRDRILADLATSRSEARGSGGGAISSYFSNQLGSASALAMSAVQAGQLLQVVGSPQVLQGLRAGTMTMMHSAGKMLGTAVNTNTRQIAGQLRFAPADLAPLVSPLVIWQVLNAVAGVVHLQRINARLESLERGLDRLTFRHQAKTYGQLVAAVATLEELSQQSSVTGTFSPDMTLRLSLAERDIRATLAEQRLLVQRFQGAAAQILRETAGKAGAVSCNQVLKEEAGEFFLDARLLTSASRASLLASEAWIRHDLEHNPRHVPSRMRDLERETQSIFDTVSPFAVLEELNTHALTCLSEMNWFSKNIFSRGLSTELKERRLPEIGNAQTTQPAAAVPSVLVWRDPSNDVRCVTIEVDVDVDVELELNVGSAS